MSLRVSCRCACRALFIQVLDVFWMFPAASRFFETKEVCSQRWQILNKSWASNHVWMFPTVGDRKLFENIHKGGYKRFDVFSWVIFYFLSFCHESHQEKKINNELLPTSRALLLSERDFCGAAPENTLKCSIKMFWLWCCSKISCTNIGMNFSKTFGASKHTMSLGII